MDNDGRSGLERKERVMDKVFLVGVNTDESKNYEKSMEELSELAQACEMEVVGSMVQNMPMIHKALYIGSGKLLELKEQAEALEADLLLMNDSLTPSQLRNLRDETQIAVMDRNTLILEIFAKRAKSHEAMLQVEVARLQYLMPRLIGLHDALSRQSGGSGFMSNKGSGEKKLELDRRRIQKRLTELRNELKIVEQERRTQTKRREKSMLPRVALVGYTNAGKSTIMNQVLIMYGNKEEKMVFEKDMLFATLDTSVRSITPKENKTILLSDTVGFIDRLPHGLVESFQSTLSEAVGADLILHVVDFSDENYREHMRVTEETLKEIGAGEVPVLYVYNKMDKTKEKDAASYPRVRKNGIYVCAKQAASIDLLLDEILKLVYAGHKVCELFLPYNRGDIFSYLKEHANVLEESYEAEGIFVKAEVGKADYERLKIYQR